MDGGTLSKTLGLKMVFRSVLRKGVGAYCFTSRISHDCQLISVGRGGMLLELPDFQSLSLLSA